ncbi:hypothetical protein CONLIGDRAFT_86062 [Coniochaeta ligniaria NRRL 30616]|uniref:Uncharacterized protein n=1 Tax=Coniochaeta ligniaria NRRL 30616 TaxID=1408157 RepID=A0A1J7JCA4_9PEZI|nr:hypothetical protein CONLIGDRAFT_86062 [Coniochaeta ligniaria NRRL 30616]
MDLNRWSIHCIAFSTLRKSMLLEICLSLPLFYSGAWPARDLSRGHWQSRINSDSKRRLLVGLPVLTEDRAVGSLLVSETSVTLLNTVIAIDGYGLLTPVAVCLVAIHLQRRQEYPTLSSGPRHRL